MMKISGRKQKGRKTTPFEVFTELADTTRARKLADK